MIGTINSVALVIGYAILSAIGIAVLGRFLFTGLSIGLWRNSSNEAKQIGAQMQQEHGYDAGASAWVADMIMEEIEKDVDVTLDEVEDE